MIFLTPHFTIAIGDNLPAHHRSPVITITRTGQAGWSYAMIWNIGRSANPTVGTQGTFGQRAHDDNDSWAKCQQLKITNVIETSLYNCMNVWTADSNPEFRNSKNAHLHFHNLISDI